MKQLLRTIWRWFVSWNIGIIVAVTVFIAADFHVLPSLLSGMGAMWGVSAVMKRRHRRLAADVPTEEQAYVRSQLGEARALWKRLRRARYRLRSVAMWQTVSRLSAIVDRIIRAVEQQPHQLRLAQPFFLNEWPTAVEMVEKYVYLSQQPVQNAEIAAALQQTERLLGELTEAAERQLLEVLSNDVWSLHTGAKMLEQSLHQSSARLHLPLSKKGE
ncbi:5-bromo-4-chloroindolyl phosphate hydrolysis family protein [Geobacillus stearothermophilus]|uniref:5-bromo-4-chloroindolyl phosphate hydrolysis family protein n=2 Tax=Geobacillus stearothermophilus TaxID=1422 RepID=UPI0005198A2D|nr:5-bromo-4-chloroindolyl phosphate hydrolysis family protein [Geobacillus stearothermophilus]MED4332768.1 5-bromo-4-chloroindolyl phosphate hydrolysis family protein [Geobacillus stearothermophilus]MED4831025.1 5-bromo-4-chloroindolyl phosphate hydrolysis family protein [Geobacillus stearothermophilus]MED4980316.1 5-bromo-4-chloroindolyl phosphate hydrolysis family protein [Geobacillus stearothermophilus]MED4996140.1 5-bromo-4-chloroindolyl phosphate hydrolysis family protein [Geobacillus ste